MKKTVFLFAVTLSFALNSCNEESSQIGKDDVSKFAKAFVERFQIGDLKKGEGASSRSRDTMPVGRDELGSMRTVVKILDGSTDAGITVPGFGGLKLGKKESNLNVYYIETKIVHDSLVYGVGYSIHYLFKKLKGGLDISNLPNVAASAQLNSNKTQVFYSIQSFGVKSLSLVRYFKPVVDKNFDVDGFGVIHAKTG